MADQDYGSKVVWLMAGVAIGSTIALLYAPASGRRDAAQACEEDAGGPGSNWRESGKEMFDRGREMYERGRKLAEDAAEMFERGRKIVEGTAANLKG